MTDMRIICMNHGVLRNVFNVENLAWLPLLQICPECGSETKVECVDHIEINPGGNDNCCPLPHVVKAAKDKEIEYYRNKYWPELKEEKNGN
jgi:hypothetical protein